MAFWKKAPRPATLEAQLEQRRAEIEAGLAELRAEALAAGPEGSDAWDRRLESLGLKVADPQERRRDALGGISQARGAPLREVELALRAWCEAERERLEPLEDAHPFSAPLRELEGELRDRPKREAEAYAALVKPTPTLSSVFATALGSSVGHLAKAPASRLTVMRCRRCGAPRASDAETQCRYCGGELYGEEGGAS